MSKHKNNKQIKSEISQTNKNQITGYFLQRNENQKLLKDSVQNDDFGNDSFNSYDCEPSKRRTRESSDTSFLQSISSSQDKDLNGSLKNCYSSCSQTPSHISSVGKYKSRKRLKRRIAFRNSSSQLNLLESSEQMNSYDKKKVDLSSDSSISSLEDSRLVLDKLTQDNNNKKQSTFKRKRRKLSQDSDDGLKTTNWSPKRRKTNCADCYEVKKTSPFIDSSKKSQQSIGDNCKSCSSTQKNEFSSSTNAGINKLGKYCFKSLKPVNSNLSLDISLSDRLQLDSVEEGSNLVSDRFKFKKIHSQDLNAKQIRKCFSIEVPIRSVLQEFPSETKVLEIECSQDKRCSSNPDIYCENAIVGNSFTQHNVSKPANAENFLDKNNVNTEQGYILSHQDEPDVPKRPRRSTKAYLSEDDSLEKSPQIPKSSNKSKSLDKLEDDESFFVPTQNNVDNKKNTLSDLNTNVSQQLDENGKLELETKNKVAQEKSTSHFTIDLTDPTESNNVLQNHETSESVTVSELKPQPEVGNDIRDVDKLGTPHAKLGVETSVAKLKIPLKLNISKYTDIKKNSLETSGGNERSKFSETSSNLSDKDVSNDDCNITHDNFDERESLPSNQSSMIEETECKYLEKSKVLSKILKKESMQVVVQEKSLQKNRKNSIHNIGTLKEYSKQNSKCKSPLEISVSELTKPKNTSQEALLDLKLNSIVNIKDSDLSDENSPNNDSEMDNSIEDDIGDCLDECKGKETFRKQTTESVQEENYEEKSKPNSTESFIVDCAGTEISSIKSNDISNDDYCTNKKPCQPECLTREANEIHECDENQTRNFQDSNSQQSVCIFVDCARESVPLSSIKPSTLEANQRKITAYFSPRNECHEQKIGEENQITGFQNTENHQNKSDRICNDDNTKTEKSSIFVCEIGEIQENLENQSRPSQDFENNVSDNKSVKRPRKDLSGNPGSKVVKQTGSVCNYKNQSKKKNSSHAYFDSEDEDISIESYSNHCNKNRSPTRPNSPLSRRKKMKNKTKKKLVTSTPLKGRSTFEMSQSNIQSQSVVEQVFNETNTTLYCTQEEEERLRDLNIEITWDLPELHTIDDGSQHTSFKSLKAKLSSKKDIDSSNFTKIESKTIKRNWKTFSEKYGFDTPEYFVSSRVTRRYLTPEQRLRFKQWLARDLPDRRLYSVYFKFCTLVTVTNRGKFTPEEDELLLKLYYAYDKEGGEEKFKVTKHVLLQKVLKRTMMSVRRRLDILLRDKHHEELTGEKIKWTPKVLGEVVYYILKKTGYSSVEELRYNIVEMKTWKYVSRKLDIPVDKLISFWKLHLYPGLFCKQHVSKHGLLIALITWFYHSDIEDWEEVNWAKLSRKAADLGGCFLHKTFKDLVNNNVPAKKHKNLKACTQYLFNIYLPKIQNMKSRKMLNRMRYNPTKRIMEEIEVEDENQNPFVIV